MSLHISNLRFIIHSSEKNNHCFKDWLINFLYKRKVEFIVTEKKEMMLRLTGMDITHCPEVGQWVIISVESLPVAGFAMSQGQLTI